MPDDASVQALVNQGQACLTAGEYDHAIAIGQRLEKYQYSYAFELMAMAYAATDELPKAIDTLERGVSLAPDVWLLWQLLGNYYSDTSRWDDARQAYFRALACPPVDPSSVHYNLAILSQREDKLADALCELDHVTSKELALKAASLRISIYTDMGNIPEAIRYAGQTLDGLTTVDDEGFDDQEAEDLAKIYVEYATAVWKQGDANRALALAWQAMALWKQEETAMWLIREIENKRSSQARYHHLTIEGVFPGTDTDDDSACGFFATYGVIADNPGEAFQMAVRFEPIDIRESLRIDECEVSPELEDDRKGVYFVSGYNTFPLEELER